MPKSSTASRTPLPRDFRLHLNLSVRELDRADIVGELDDLFREASLTLADALGLLPVAEGVETVHQRAWLTERGCRYGQGFLFGRAVSAEEFTGWLGSGQRLPA